MIRIMNLSGVCIHEVERDTLVGVDLSRLTLQNANFEDMDLSRVDFRGCDLIGSRFDRSLLRDTDFSGAELAHCNFIEADLTDSVLEHTNLCVTNFMEADLTGANLFCAKLDTTYFRRATLNGMVLPLGDTYEEYLYAVVPELLQVRDRDIAELLDLGAWECHVWENCPMAAAFGVYSQEQISRLHRPRVEEFIVFFDAYQIPKPRRLSTGGWTCLPEEHDHDNP